MKITYLLLVLFLWTPFCAKAQKKPFIIEKQLEVIKKEPENSNALKFLCQYYLNKGEFSKTITYAEYMKNKEASFKCKHVSDEFINGVREKRKEFEENKLRA